MRKGISHAVTLIIVAVFIVIVVIMAVFLTTMYNPPVPLSQQIGNCAVRSIQLEDYTRQTESARDAARYITVKYNHHKVSPCQVNGDIGMAYSTCHLGTYNQILLEVDETSCNMVDVNITEE